MKQLKVSLNRKSDHTVAGELLMEARELISEESLTIEQRIEVLKRGSQAINDRLNLRAEQRRDALANCAISEQNSKFNSNFKIESIELSDPE